MLALLDPYDVLSWGHTGVPMLFSHLLFFLIHLILGPKVPPWSG